MNEILIHHRTQFEEMFQKKLSQEEGEEKLAVQDCFEFLKEALNVANIGIKERIDKEEDLFKSKDCNRKLMNIASKYFFQVIGEGK